MIWEVDEDCDQCVTWAEFQTMYHRCRRDQTGETRNLLSGQVTLLAKWVAQDVGQGLVYCSRHMLRPSSQSHLQGLCSRRCSSS